MVQRFIHPARGAVVAVEHARPRIVAKSAGAAHVTAVQRSRGLQRPYVKKWFYRTFEPVAHHHGTTAQFVRIAIGIDYILIRACLCRYVVFWIGEIFDDAGKHCPRAAQECSQRCNPGDQRSRQMLQASIVLKHKRHQVVVPYYWVRVNIAQLRPVVDVEIVERQTVVHLEIRTPRGPLKCNE